MPAPGESLAKHYAEGRLVTANECMCSIMQAGNDIPSELAHNIRSKVRLVQELAPQTESRGGCSSWQCHPIMAPNALDVYERMEMQHHCGVEWSYTQLTFETEYEWPHLECILSVPEVVKSVFADQVADITLLSEETPTTKVLLVNLHRPFPRVTRQPCALVRVSQVREEAKGTLTHAPVLVVQDARDEKSYLRYINTETQSLVSKFGAVCYVQEGIERSVVSVCVRRNNATGVLSQWLRPVLNMAWRCTFLRAVHVWLVMASQVFHGDSQVSNVLGIIRRCGTPHDAVPASPSTPDG